MMKSPLVGLVAVAVLAAASTPSPRTSEPAPDPPVGLLQARVLALERLHGHGQPKTKVSDKVRKAVPRAAPPLETHHNEIAALQRLLTDHAHTLQRTTDRLDQLTRTTSGNTVADAARQLERRLDRVSRKAQDLEQRVRRLESRR